MNSTLEIHPLTRVEGHGRIMVSLRGERVEKITLSLYESPRLFEALLRGKSYAEVPEIVCRICSLCSTVHRVCSILAVEKALGIAVSDLPKLYRELILLGGQIQSHALHLFCLVLPDYIGAVGLPGLTAKAASELNRGLRIKAAGNLIQEIVGGRLIHPVTLIPGGMGKQPTKDSLLHLKDTLEAVLPETRWAYELFRSFVPAQEKRAAPRYGAVMRDLASSFYGDCLVIASGEKIPLDGYRNQIHEELARDGNAKATLVNGQPMVVGALARLNLGLYLAPLASTAFMEAAELIVGRDVHANNLAQTIELIHAVERSREIINTLLAGRFDRDKPTKISIRKGTGSAAIEAPRGVLIHSYSFDSRGLCTDADIITPTAINQEYMRQDLLTLAKQLEGAGDETMIASLERLVRAYDPCISCAVHIVRI